MCCSRVDFFMLEVFSHVRNVIKKKKQNRYEVHSVCCVQSLMMAPSKFLHHSINVSFHQFCMFQEPKHFNTISLNVK